MLSMLSIINFLRYYNTSIFSIICVYYEIPYSCWGIYHFSLEPFTKLYLFFPSIFFSCMVPLPLMDWTMYGLSHQIFNFLEWCLYWLSCKSTCSPTSNSWFLMCLLCHAFYQFFSWIWLYKAIHQFSYSWSRVNNHP